MIIFTLKTIIVAAGVLLLFSPSCTNNTSSNEKIYASSIAGSSATKKLTENDFRFLVKAHSTGLFKIDLANEASVRSTSLEAIQFASAIKSFYTKFNYEIEDIAVKHDFVLPMDITDDEKLVWKELVKEKGWEFDKKFREIFERYHSEEVVFFEAAAVNTVDKHVALLATKAQPEIKFHEKLSNVLCEKIEARTMVVPEKNSHTNAPKRSKGAVAKS